MTDDEKTEVPVAPRDQSQVEDSDRLSLKAKSINNDHEVLESRTSMKDYTDRDIESAEQAIQPPEPPYSVYSHREKASMILLVSFAAIISPLSGAVYLPILPSLARDLDISTSLINLTVTTYLVLQGVAPSFIGNLSDVYGRRPAYMICCIVYLAANIGLAVQNSYAALLTLRCLQSCGSSATIALAGAVASDLATRAERGKYLGYAAMGVTLGPALGPVIGGLIDQYLGWRWIFWFLTILSGTLFLVLFIFLPETGRSVVGNGSIPSPWWNMSLLAYIKQRRRRRQIEEVDLESVKLPRRRPNPFASLKILGERGGCITLLCSSLMYGGYYMLLTTLSSELSSRFGFSSVIIGLCYLPIGIGSLTYRHTGGYLLDWNFRRHAKAAGIVISHNRQQDMDTLPIEKIRLQVSLPFVYLSSVLVIAYGWAMESKSSLAGIEISLFLCGMFFSASLNGLNTLIIDTHINMPATAMAANNLCRCLVGAGAAAISAPLINRVGMGWASVLVAGIWIGLSPLLWLVMAKGPSWRQAENEKRDAAQAKRGPALKGAQGPAISQ
ncbi:MFS general substrate transporter [Hypoxylon rubiginosum]|uniref:MFS general substrate transporter n=1 Tax=Hypoxylon rubiginosum TaxID=110542 RepID=A0ACB9Z3R1_9PEZI|nr:MFS general substrate transporter [Hypoxylon rubiginosum]